MKDSLIKGIDHILQESRVSLLIARALLDANLMRVISRLFEVNLDIGNPSNRWAFQEIAEILIDPGTSRDFNQALMDLGSDIESPVNPRPEESPVKEFSAKRIKMDDAYLSD